MSADNRTTNDLLLQLLEEQTNQGKVLAELKGNIVVRVESLESSRKTNWWATYVIAPILGIAHGVCAHYGIKI